MSPSAAPEVPQIKSRIGAILRATSGNFLEQFDFFLFGFYASAIAKAFFPAENETAALAQHVRRVLARRPDAPGRRDRARRLYRPDRTPQGTDRDAGDHGGRHRDHRGLSDLCEHRRRGSGHRADRAAAAGLFGRRRTRRRFGLSLRDFHARQQGLLHLVSILKPAGRNLRGRADRIFSQRGHAAGCRRRLGLANSVLYRLPHHPVHFLPAANAGGNAGIPRDEKTPDRIGSIRVRDRQLADRRARHDAGGDDDGDVLFRHGLYARPSARTC